MSVKIRLARIGTKNAPAYRIVAIDGHSKRDGKALEILGTYNPLSKTIVQFHEDRLKAWVAQGADMSDAVKKICKLQRKQSQTAAQ